MERQTRQKLKLGGTIGVIALALLLQSVSGRAGELESGETGRLRTQQLMATESEAQVARLEEVGYGRHQRRGFFIITGTFAVKGNAYRFADENGGVVLKTSRYPRMTPGYYAVGWGPFSEGRAYEVQAENELGGYVKRAW